MPNWCENILVVMGSKDEVKKFHSKVEDGKMLENHLPTPAELLLYEVNHIGDTGKVEHSENMIKLYGSKDWYDWRCNNWGTKWEVDDFYGTETDNESDSIVAYVYNFNTAWAPPEIGVEKISSMYKDVVFHLQFEEPGMAFEGYCRCLNGETIGQETHEMYEKWDRIVDNLRDDYKYTIETYKKEEE